MIGMSEEELKNELVTAFTKDQIIAIVNMTKKNNDRIEKQLKDGLKQLFKEHVSDLHRR